MGVFYNSICVPGDRREEIRRILGSWLGLKGFVPRAGTVLFDLDGDSERCAYLVSNESWTILFYSHYEEERRLLRALQGELAPLLYLWVHDSDVWGYDLLDHAGFTGSWGSDPSTWKSFPDETGVGRPRTQATGLARVLGLADEETLRELRRIERSSSAFPEEDCRELAAALGVEPAASSYDDLENGTLDTLPGWTTEQLLFADPDLDTSSAMDLHAEQAAKRQTREGLEFEETVELPEKVVAELQSMQKRLRFVYRLLRPVSWLARKWGKVLEAIARVAGQDEQEPVRLRSPQSGFHLESAVLKNDRHRCRITLAEGVKPGTGSAKPASVFAFKVGEVLVTCTARPPWKVDENLRRPNRSKVLRDEKYLIGPRKARHFLFELPPSFVAGTHEPSYLALYVIQASQALYVFLYRYKKPLVQADDNAIRATVRSFRMLDE